MRRHWAHLIYVLRHRWYILGECMELGVPAFHDRGKFLPGEWLPYARTFCASNGAKQYAENMAFARAWNAHQKRNKHHWLVLWDQDKTEALPMPDVYHRKMLADWRGASQTSGKPDTRSWRLKNWEAINLRLEAREWVEKSLGVFQ